VSVTTLYRFHDTDGELLYVGITERGPERWKAHRKDKSWWTDVTSITTEHYDTRTEALDAERAAIIAEQPKHNVVHNSGSRKCQSTITSEWDDPRHPFNRLPEADNGWMDTVMRRAYINAMTAIDAFLHVWGQEGTELGNAVPTITAGIELLTIADQCPNPNCDDAWTHLPEPPISYDGATAIYICRHCGTDWSCGWNNNADMLRAM
jgi:predicted GIY-YIG superfamily endonuclease